MLVLSAMAEKVNPGVVFYDQSFIDTRLNAGIASADALPAALSPKYARVVVLRDSDIPLSSRSSRCVVTLAP